MNEQQTGQDQAFRFPFNIGGPVLSTILDQSQAMIFLKDKESRYLYANLSKARHHGFDDPADLIGKTDFDLLPRLQAHENFVKEQEIMNSAAQPQEKLEMLAGRMGEVGWASVMRSPIFGEGNEILGTWCVCRDITQYEKVRRELLENEARFQAMIENISDVIAIIDAQNNISYISPNVERFFGWTVAEALGINWRDLIHPADKEKILHRAEGFAQFRGSIRKLEFRCRCKDDQYKMIEVTASNQLLQEKIHGFLVNIHDISDRVMKEEEILYLSYHDVMTGLYNRSFFEEEKSRLNTRRQLPISIIMGDVNGLKLINDAYGHAEGDKLLITVANILRKSCRQEEIIARIGGDEFCILLPQTRSEVAQEICSRIFSACEEYRQWPDDQPVYPSIALGYATKTDESESLDQVMKAAEDFMYQRKMFERTSAHSSIMNSIRATMHESSLDTEQHSERLIELSEKVGAALDLNEEQLFELNLLARLHDIGKICIDEYILQKPDKLTEAEWLKVRQHPEVGFRIAQASSELIRISYLILCHHERWDGKGYPRGLIGKEIPLLSRIIAVIDAYDAMIQDRPYRKALSFDEAVREIKANAGDQFDPQIARVFLEQVLGVPWQDLLSAPDLI